MKLYIKRFDDYRTGIDIIVLDEEKLKRGYLSDQSYDSDSEDSEVMTNEKFNDKLDMDLNIWDRIILNNIYKNTYAVYLIYGEGYHEPKNTNIVHIINNDNKDDAISMMKYLYSDINGYQPFVKTGYVENYKPDGYYPDPLPKFFINSNPAINKLIEITNQVIVLLLLHNDDLIDF